MMKLDCENLVLILAAAGSSTRMGLGKKKEYITLGSGTVLSKSARAFLQAAHFSKIIISIPKNGEEEAKKAFYADKEIYKELKDTEVLFVEGGNTRQQSVYNALLKATENNETSKTIVLKTLVSKTIVLIHDAARPFVTKKIIQDVINSAKQYGSATPAIPVVDTQKEVFTDGTICKHLQRSKLVAVQTPQAFLLHELLLCHKEALKTQKEYTDDTEIWDSYPKCTGEKKVHIVEGNTCNKKITYKEDIFNKKMHIGLGTDLHRLVEGRKLFIGGIEIPSKKGELAHSDGDVLLHAICDALLGASGLGDIGSYFPSEDIKWKDANSADLTKKIWSDVKQNGWSLINLDCVIELESPKFLPWRSKVISSIANILEVEESKVFVKAKTNEKLESVGESKAIKAYCTCLLETQ